MTFAPLEKRERAAFREMLNPQGSQKTGAAVLMLLLSSLIIPLCTNEILSMLYLGYAAVFYYSLTRSVPAVLLVALPGVPLFALSSYVPGLATPFALPAVYAALVLGAVGGAFLIIHNRKPARALSLLSLPVAAYAAAYLATSSPYKALLVLLPAVLALVLALCILNCCAHTPSVLLLACVAAAMAAIGFLLYLLVMGWPVANPLSYLADSVRAGVVGFYRQMVALYAESGLELPFSEMDIKNMAALLGNVLPGVFGIACLLLAYVTWRVMLRLMIVWQTLPRVPLRLAAVTVSPMAAGVFTLAYVIAFFANTGTATLLGTVCQNLYLLFLPALSLMGFSVIMKKRADRTRFSGFLLVALVATLFISISTALALASFIGAFHILAAYFTSHDKGGH